MKMRYLSFLCIMIMAAACSKSQEDGADDNKAVVLQNQTYGSHVRHTFDAYLPEGRTTAATHAVILIHGGSWISGDKSDLNSHLNTLRSRLPNLAFFSVNYRFAIAEHERFPAQEKDIEAAVNHIISKKNDYKISGKYVVAGFSSGGQLALLQAYKNYGSNKSLGVISISGPTDLKLLYQDFINPATRPLLQTVTGSDPETNPEIYKTSSPVNYVKEGIPATLLLHGQLDEIVPVSQATLLKGLLANLNAQHKTIIYPSAGHSFHGTNITDALIEIEEFLKLHLK